MGEQGSALFAGGFPEKPWVNLPAELWRLRVRCLLLTVGRLSGRKAHVLSNPFLNLDRLMLLFNELTW